ncbi:MAG: GntR family transcriptional regulator [Burkholderiaceae bacterium]
MVLASSQNEFSSIQRGPGSAKSEIRSADEHPKPRRGELQDRVAQQLRRSLMVGQIVPGQPLSLRQLAQQLGTSPMPVREVISQLTAAGVLEALPNRSVMVARMTPSRFIELTRVRTALEGMAAEMACERVTPQLIAQLEKLDAQLHKAIERRDILGCLSYNQAFHFALYAASQSEILPGLIEALWLRAGPFMYFSLTNPTMQWDASGHADILESLRNGKAAATRRAIEHDIAVTAKNLLKKSSAFRGNLGPLTTLHTE